MKQWLQLQQHLLSLLGVHPFVQGFWGLESKYSRMHRVFRSIFRVYNAKAYKSIEQLHLRMHQFNPVFVAIDALPANVVMHDDGEGLSRPFMRRCTLGCLL